MSGPFHFSWTGAGTGEDEEIFAIEIRHVEGDFATLNIDIVNPRVGLLAAGRSVWGSLAYDHPTAGTMAIFTGRLVGIPDNLFDEVVRLQFIARPADYPTQQAAIADTLKVPPYWDPIWLQSHIDDPNTVLEARPQLWHVDRVSLAVSVSDIIVGEDGIVSVTQDDHFYDAMTVTYGQTPLTSVKGKGTVTWTQTGGASLDLTNEMISAFQASGSPLGSPLIASLTGDGLLSSWPMPGTTIGGGWSMADDSYAVNADWVNKAYYHKVFTAPDIFPDAPPLPSAPNPIPPGTAASQWAWPSAWEYPTQFAANIFTPTGFFGQTNPKIWAFVAPVYPLAVHFSLDMAANRKRSETVTFTLDADVQPIITDPGTDSQASIELSSDAITTPIDPGGVAPLPDSRSPSYFKTARGAQSFEYLVALARAKLLSRARCVLLKFVTQWDFVLPWISCRYSVALQDYRLPGGGVVGKVTGYVLQYSTDGISAEVTLACTVGRGGSASPTPGTPSYVADNYFLPQTDYQAFLGTQVSLVPGEITYLSFDDFQITDALDLFNPTADTALVPVPGANISTTANVILKSTSISGIVDTTGLQQGIIYQIDSPAGVIPPETTMTYNGNGGGTLSAAALSTFFGGPITITGRPSNGITIIDGPADQVNAINTGTKGNMPDPAGALKSAATHVCINLVSVDGGELHTDFPMQVSPLAVPKTIDLEA